MQLQWVHPAVCVGACADATIDQVNATWACENDRTLNQLLKSELGFQGFVMSDWFAQHSTISAIAGLDVSASPLYLRRGAEARTSRAADVYAR